MLCANCLSKKEANFTIIEIPRIIPEAKGYAVLVIISIFVIFIYISKSEKQITKIVTWL